MKLMKTLRSFETSELSWIILRKVSSQVGVNRSLSLTRRVDPSFAQLYYSLGAWMISSGLYNHEDSYQLITLTRKRIACFDGELLRELSWNIFWNSENGDKSENVSTMVSTTLLRHEACLDSLTKDDCPFYHDSKGPFARTWSDNQFWIVHEEFRSLTSALTGVDSERSLEQLNDDRLHETLQILHSKSISQKLLYPSYIRVTMQYSGQSQIAGTKMMHFVEDRILDLISGRFCTSRTILSMTGASYLLPIFPSYGESIARTNTTWR